MTGPMNTIREAPRADDPETPTESSGSGSLPREAPQERSGVKFLSGQRVYLRPIDPRTDAERYYRWMNDREVTRWLLSHAPIPYPAELAWLEGRAKERPTTDHTFAVCLHEGDAHIGSVGIHRIDWVDRTGSTGWMIGAKEHWRRGYGFEMVCLLLHYGFHILNLRKVNSATVAPNTGSNRIHEKCGYTLIGRRTAQFFRSGAFVDELLFDCTAEDFARVWEEHHRPLMPAGSNR